MCGKSDSRDSRELWVICHYYPVELLGLLVKAVPCHAVCMGCSLYCHKSLMCGKVTMWLTEAERLPIVLVVVLKEKW